MSVYCNNENCEYNEDGCCEYEGSIVIDNGGFCTRFRYKEVANGLLEETYLLLKKGGKDV